MSKTKKILSLLIALMLVLSSVLVACDPDGPDIEITKIEVGNNPRSIYLLGQALDLTELQIKATWSDASTTVLRSSEYTVSTVDPNTEGSKTVTVTLKADTTKTTSFVVVYTTQLVSVDSVAISKTGLGDGVMYVSEELTVGGSLQLYKSVFPATATNSSVNWSSNNELVASVSAVGVVTALKEGMADIKVQSVDGNKVAYVRVLVKKASGTPATYTQNSYVGALPAAWNPLTWQQNNEQQIMLYMVSGLYTTQMDQARDNYKYVPMLASSDPVDVTDQYVGRYGIVEGTSQRAWKISLNETAKWSNGDVITADDYLYSLERALAPEMMNHRSNSHTSGQGQIYGAVEYLNQGKTVALPAAQVIPFASYVAATHDALLKFSLFEKDSKAASVFQKFCADYGVSSVADAASFLTANNCEITADEITALNGKTYAQIKASDVLGASFAKLTALWMTEEYEILDFFITDKTFPKVTFADTVGLIKLDDHTLVYVYANPLDKDGVYLYGGNDLVHKATFEAAYNAYTPGQGLLVSQYMTSKANSISYGPYKMAAFSSGQEIKFERNEYWPGWSKLDERAFNPTTHETIKVISDITTVKNTFEAGNLDSMSIAPTQIQDFAQSSRQVFSLSTSGFVERLYLVTDKDSLKKIDSGSGYFKGENIEANTLLLSYTDFREAMFYMVNRAELTNTATPGSIPAYYLLGEVFHFDTGRAMATSYRPSTSGKSVVTDLFKLRYQGDGKGDLNGAHEYEDIDEAINAAAGSAFDVERAKASFQKAYLAAKAAGEYVDGSAIKLTCGVAGDFVDFPETLSIYAGLMQKYFTEATKGTGFEGKITFKMINLYGVENRYNLVNGKDEGKGMVSMIMGANGGAIMRPEYLLRLFAGYDESSMKYDSPTALGLDSTKIKFSHTIDGEAVEKSVAEWLDLLNSGGTYAAWKPGVVGSTAEQNATFVALTAKVELALLETYFTVPLQAVASRSLLGYKVEYSLEKQHPSFNRGGIMYRYTDAEWVNFVKTNAVGGKLDYNK